LAVLKSDKQGGELFEPLGVLSRTDLRSADLPVHSGADRNRCRTAHQPPQQIQAVDAAIDQGAPAGPLYIQKPSSCAVGGGPATDPSSFAVIDPAELSRFDALLEVARLGS